METKKILVIVDMQIDFINGSLGTQEAEAIVPGVVRRIQDAISQNLPVILTKDTHTESYLTTQEGSFLPVPHCIAGTAGWEFPDAIKAELKKGQDVSILEKNAFGSFELPKTVSTILDKHNWDEKEVHIEIMGLCTDICVVSNAIILKTAFPETAIHVIPDCCAGVTPEKHRHALDTLASCQVIIG
ncbi:MAG: cysteine hydrolase [Clostridia bacterium]|nr:cysteine hydrolase [Clostridia bacterium]